MRQLIWGFQGLAMGMIGVVGLLSAGAPFAQEAGMPLNVLVTNERATSAYPVYVADELGFYEDEGLDVTFLPTNTTVPYLAFLANGQADLVIVDPPQTLQAVANGEPISLVYEYMQRTPEALVVPQSSDIRSIADLEGRTIGLAHDRDQITVDVALESAGMEPGSVNTVVIGDSVPLIVNQLNNGSIHGYAGGSNETSGLESAGISLIHLTPLEFSQQPGNFVALWGPRTDELRDPATAFLRAFNKAMTAALLDPDAIAAMSRKIVPEQWEDLDRGWSILEQSMYGLLLQRTRLRGELQPDLWPYIQQLYLDLGEIEQTYDTATFMDDSFIEPAMDFETSQVKEALAEWRTENQEHLLD